MARRMDCGRTAGKISSSQSFGLHTWPDDEAARGKDGSGTNRGPPG